MRAERRRGHAPRHRWHRRRADPVSAFARPLARSFVPGYLLGSLLLVVVGLARPGLPAYGAAHAGPHAWAWGQDLYGQLGGAAGGQCYGLPCSVTPQQVPGLPAAAGVAAGSGHSLALGQDGTV